jgi:hypothetical protein
MHTMRFKKALALSHKQSPDWKAARNIGKAKGRI